MVIITASKCSMSPSSNLGKASVVLGNTSWAAKSSSVRLRNALYSSCLTIGGNYYPQSNGLIEN